MKETLSEQVLYANNSFRKVRRYLRGWLPKEGRLCYGVTGKETIQVKDVVTPKVVYNVADIEVINEHFDSHANISYSIEFSEGGEQKRRKNVRHGRYFKQ